MDGIVGIDLGTTNSVVAYFEQGQPIVIQNSEGSKTTPSVVFFKSPEEIIVGELARRNMLMYPKQVIRSVKRFMGAYYSEIERKRRGIAYDLVEGPDNSVMIDVGWGRVSPEQVSAEILKKMKRTAEDYFGETVYRAVVTVPAYFNDNQRAATKRAGEMAELEVVRIINEPTAAALAYGVDKTLIQRIAVFDYGGGTFDMSVLEIDRDVFEVKSTYGDTFLGGDNIDDVLFAAARDQFQRKTGVDVSTDLQASQRLRETVERVKCELSSTQSTVVSLPFLTANEQGPLHMDEPITRSEFDALIVPTLRALTECCRNAMQDARVSPREIAQVLLVGGSTRIPAVQALVSEFFGKAPNRSLNPDEAVAIGAAIQGSILTGGLREVLLLDVTPLSLGIELAGGVFSALIPRNSSIPTSAQKRFTTVRDNQTVVKIHVLQGERRIARENQSLGYFRLLGITPAPKEIPEINVRFQIDANGILNVSASDATSGVSNSITIENYALATEEEAAEVLRAAEIGAEQDKLFLRRNYIKGQADPDIAQLTRFAQETSDPELQRVIREALFKFDVAFSAADNVQLEEAFVVIRRLAKELADQLYVPPGA